MTINVSFPLLERMAAWKHPEGAIVHTWHSQSWATHMFRVSGHSVGPATGHLGGEVEQSVSLTFSSGGQQGGRNWFGTPGEQCIYTHTHSLALTQAHSHLYLDTYTHLYTHKLTRSLTLTPVSYY